MVWVYWTVGILAAAGALLLGLDAYTRWMRRKILMAKYGDAEAVAKIMRHVIWQGMTADQVADALGEPEIKEQKVMKTKTVETWKYGQKTRTRFKWRITIEDGLVTGWEEK
jgi:outer membrane protein assembly factor BamE (lipoprotein component of BamABCDE complex)